MRKTGTYAQYLRQVEEGLHCAKAERKRLLAGLKDELEEAAARTPEPAMAELEERFGRPRAVAAELEEALEPGNVARYETVRTRIIRGLAVACAFAILLALFWFVKCQQAQEITNRMHVVISPVETMTDEEMEEIFGPMEGE